MIKAFKLRIYPNSKQEILIQKTFGCVRYIYNHFLDRKEKAFEAGEKGLGFTTLSRELTQLKKEFEWLKEPDKWALQNSVKHLSEAYDRFFAIQKVGPKYTDKKLKHLAEIGKEPTRFDMNGHPQFKSKKNNYKSYTTTFTNNSVEIIGNTIKLPKLGKVKFKDKVKLEGRILNVTISQEPSGKYYVSVCCTDIEFEPLVKTNKQVGIDLGLKEFSILSDGIKFENPKYLKSNLAKLKRLQRDLSRKSIGSNRWNKARIRVAKLHEHIRNLRNDYLQKLTTNLIKAYDIICLETLKVKNMVQNHKLAQAISDVSWSKFIEMLKYKAEWYGKKVIQIDTFFASSQLCHVCGYKNEDVKNLSIREWTCPNCNTHHDRDINASINILNKGLELA